MVPTRIRTALIHPVDSSPAAMTVPSARRGFPDWTRLMGIARKPVFGWTCLALIVVTTGALVLLGCVPGSPLVGTLPRGAATPSVLTNAARAVGFDELNASQSPILAYVLIAGVCAGFLGTLLAISQHGISTRSVIACSTVVIALATVGPPLFSHDLYSYALYGRMWALHHLNPYVQAPSVAANDPFRPVASNGLRSVYGPLFTVISGSIVWIFRSPAATVAAFKVLSGACWLGVVVLAARLGRREGVRQASFAAAIVGLNPVVVSRVVTGGHNDVLVALAIMAALTAWCNGHKILVTVFLTLGMLVKIVTVIPLAIFLWEMIRAESTVRDRIVTLGKHLAVIVTLTAAALIPFRDSLRTISSFSTLTSFSSRTPEVIISSASASVLRSLGWSREVALSNDIFQVAFLGVAALALLLLLRRSDRPIPETVLLALLVFLLCSRYQQAWYLAWFIPLICFVTRRRVIAIALALTLIAAESATAKSTGPILPWLARFSYDVYPALAFIFLVLLLVEVVRRPSTAAQETQVETFGGQRGEAVDLATAVAPIRKGFGGRSTF